MERRLYRSSTDKYIGGVCGGLAEYFGIDPAIIRISFLFLFLAKGVGLLAYIILWIAVRRRPMGVEIAPAPPRTGTWGRYLPGIILVLLGVVFLINENWYWLDLEDVFDRFWPLILIGVGAALLLYRGNRHQTIDSHGLGSSSTHNQNGEATV